MPTGADLAPKTSFWRETQFDTLRLGLIKLALPTGFAYQQEFSALATRLAAPPP